MIFPTAMVFITAMEAIVRAQCPGPMVIGQRTGEIKSPNLGSGAEYGEKANCSWMFGSTEWTNYALKVDVLFLRLYYVSGGSKKCVAGSYNLTIAADRLKCDKFAREGDATFCHLYYNSYTCGNISKTSNCEVSKLNDFPVEVKYEADGRIIPGVYVNAFEGFRIRHQFVECPEPTTTTGNGIGSTTVSKDISQHATSTATTVETTESLSSTTSTDSRETTTNGVKDTANAYSNLTTTTSPLPIVAGVMGGGVLLLLLLLLIAVCNIRKLQSKLKTEAKQTTTSESQQVGNYEIPNDGPYQNYEAVDTPARQGKYPIPLQENPGYEPVTINQNTNTTSLYEIPMSR